jgi:uncharacterized protein
MRARGCTALLSLILMSSAQAASFDCAKASSFVEKAICSDKRLSSMDDQLARLYKAARAAATNASALETEQKSVDVSGAGSYKRTSADAPKFEE